jgi:hypothetical protein
MEGVGMVGEGVDEVGWGLWVVMEASKGLLEGVLVA